MKKTLVFGGWVGVDLHKNIHSELKKKYCFLADFCKAAAHVQVPCKFFSKGLCFIGFATSTLDDPDS